MSPKMKLKGDKCPPNKNSEGKHCVISFEQLGPRQPFIQSLLSLRMLFEDLFSLSEVTQEFRRRLCRDYIKLFFPGLLYLPILLFDFGKSQQTIPVLLRQDHYKAFVKFLYISLSVSEKWN